MFLNKIGNFHFTGSLSSAAFKPRFVNRICLTFFVEWAFILLIEVYGFGRYSSLYSMYMYSMLHLWPLGAYRVYV